MKNVLRDVFLISARVVSAQFAIARSKHEKRKQGGNVFFIAIGANRKNLVEQARHARDSFLLAAYQWPFAVI